MILLKSIATVKQNSADRKTMLNGNFLFRFVLSFTLFYFILVDNISEGGEIKN